MSKKPRIDYLIALDEQSARWLWAMVQVLKRSQSTASATECVMALIYEAYEYDDEACAVVEEHWPSSHNAVLADEEGLRMNSTEVQP